MTIVPAADMILLVVLIVLLIPLSFRMAAMTARRDELAWQMTDEIEALRLRLNAIECCHACRFFAPTDECENCAMK